MGTPALVRPLGIRLPLIGAKGYSADVAGPEIGRALYLCEAKIGLSPMADHTRVGGFFEIGATSARPHRQRALQLLTDTVRYVPDFPTDLPTGRRGPGRPAAGDPRQPALPGRTPAGPGVIVAAGHGMLGITLAATTATAVAELAASPSPPGSTPSAQTLSRPVGPRGASRLRCWQSDVKSQAPIIPPGVVVNNGARHRYSAERTESTGGRCRAAVCQLWPPSTEPNSSPEVAPK